MEWRRGHPDQAWVTCSYCHPPPQAAGAGARWSGRQAGRAETRGNLLRTPELSAGWTDRHGPVVEHLPGAAAAGTRSWAGPRAVLGAFRYTGHKMVTNNRDTKQKTVIIIREEVPFRWELGRDDSGRWGQG